MFSPADHKKTLDTWSLLPTDLKRHVQQFFKAQKPTIVCEECRLPHFHKLEQACGGLLVCQPCLNWDPDETPQNKIQ